MLWLTALTRQPTAAASFNLTGALTTAREYHTATLLQMACC